MIKEDKQKEAEAKEEESKEEESKAEASQEESNDNNDSVEVPEKFQELVSKIEEMSVLELSELVKVLEDKFGVSSAAPVAAAAPAGGGGDGEGAAEESATVDVELASAGDNKIGVIKAVREVTELGLKDAKELVEDLPKPIKEGVEREAAEEMKKKLEEAGGEVNLK